MHALWLYEQVRSILQARLLYLLRDQTVGLLPMPVAVAGVEFSVVCVSVCASICLFFHKLSRKPLQLDHQT